MKQPLTATEGQFEHFGHIIDLPNNRPIQALNTLTILE